MVGLTVLMDNMMTCRQYWIDGIFSLIPGKFEQLEREYVGKLIDRMLVEISEDYYRAMCKAILDYVLINEEERYRLGIMNTFFPIVIYGDGYYQGSLSVSLKTHSLTTIDCLFEQASSLVKNGVERWQLRRRSY